LFLSASSFLRAHCPNFADRFRPATCLSLHPSTYQPLSPIFHPLDIFQGWSTVTGPPFQVPPWPFFSPPPSFTFPFSSQPNIRLAFSPSRGVDQLNPDVSSYPSANAYGFFSAIRVVPWARDLLAILLFPFFPLTPAAWRGVRLHRFRVLSFSPKRCFAQLNPQSWTLTPLLPYPHPFVLSAIFWFSVFAPA